MEICTERLSPAQLRDELPRLLDWLREQGVRTLYAWYGVGCKVAKKDRGAIYPLSLAEITPFLRDSMNRGIYRFGESELHFDLAHWMRRKKQPKVVPRLTLGTEFDVRFESDDDALIESMKSAWLAKGFRGYARQDRTSSDWIAFP